METVAKEARRIGAVRKRNARDHPRGVSGSKRNSQRSAPVSVVAPSRDRVSRAHGSDGAPSSSFVHSFAARESRTNMSASGGTSRSVVSGNSSNSGGEGDQRHNKKQKAESICLPCGIGVKTMRKSHDPPSDESSKSDEARSKYTRAQERLPLRSSDFGDGFKKWEEADDWGNHLWDPARHFLEIV